MGVGISLVEKLKGKKKVIFNSFWVVFDRIIRMLGGLVVGIWFARYLGPYNFGAWSYAFGIVSLAIPFINLGLTNILLTDLIREEDKGRTLFTGLVIKLCSGTIMAIVIYLFSFTLNAEPVTRSVLVILSFQCIFQACDVFDIFYQSRTESKNSVFAKTTAYVVVNCIKLYAVIHGYKLEFFAYLTVSELVFSSIILCYFYFNLSKQKIAAWKFDLSIVRSLLTRSYPFLIAELLIVLYTRLDQFMLKNMIGNVELGKYTAATRLSEMWYFVAGALSVGIYPSILKLKEKSETDFLNGFQKLLNILVTISVAISLFFTFFSGIITHLLFGDKYPGIGSILSIHIWTGVFVYLGVGTSNWFIVNGLQKYIMVRTLTGFVINVILNFILIPPYHSIGAAISTLIAQLASSVIANAFSKQTRPIFWLQIRAFKVLINPSVKNYI